MSQELFLFAFIDICGGLLSALLCIYAYYRIRNAPGGIFYILGTFCCMLFTFFYVFELTSTTLEHMKIWLRLEYLALPFIPVFTLFMCMEYVGVKWSRPLYYFFFGLPSLTILIHYTNDFHHFYYKSVGVDTSGAFPTLSLEGGPWFYVHSFFLYACVLGSIILLLAQLRKGKARRFKWQIATMTAGLFVPVLGSVFYLTGLSPNGIDLGPISMSVSFIFHGAAIISLQMFSVAPIAREKVFDSMEEGVLVLNQNNVIVDFNPVMQTMVPAITSRSIGKSVKEMLKGNESLLDIVVKGEKQDYMQETLHYQIKFTPVLHRKKHLGQIITFVDVTERILMQEQLKAIASVDGLTNVYTRSFFLQKTDELFDLDKVAIIMFDIDHFKRVNDTFGHKAGDIVLKQVVQFAKQHIRAADFIGRYGGEEFIICLPNTSQSDAVQVAEAIRLEVEKTTVKVDEAAINVTASLGVTSAVIANNESEQLIASLMDEADIALYEAKNDGRNCVRSFEKSAGILTT